MADDAARSRLGRGLAALIGDVGAEIARRPSARAASAACRSNIVRANPRNPRKLFSDAELDELAALDPRARHHPADRGAPARGADDASRSSPASGAGARRSAPACTKCRSSCSKSSDSEALELAIIENVQRTDLNPLEEAGGYQALADEFNHSQDDIAKIVGKSRSHVANTLRLLKLPEPVKAYINAGKLSAGHARALIGQPDAEAAGATRSSSAGSTSARSRRWRAGAAEAAGKSGQDARAQAARMPTRRAGEAAVRCARPGGRRSIIAASGGVLQVRYRTLDQLDDVIRRLEK